MRRSPLGSTGLDVSAATIGTARAGVATFARAAACALERGVNAVELDAGDPVAVAAVGRVLAQRGDRGSVHVFARAASLVPFDLPSPHVPAQQAYPGANLRAQVERLLQALRIERLGLLQLHAWCPEWLHEGDWAETCARLRDEGKIAGVGLSLFDHDVDAAREAVETRAVDAVQVMVNILDPAAAARLLPLCARHGVGAIVRSPLYYGMLAAAGQRPRGFSPDDWRRAFFFDAHLRETSARADRIAAVLATDSLADVALRFAASHPAVATVAIGMASPEHVVGNLAALEQGPLEPELRTRLAAHRWLC